MRRAAISLFVLSAALAGSVGALLPGVAGAAQRAEGATIEQRWQSARTHVVLVMGTSDYPTGEIRVSFLVIASDGRALTAPGARLSLSRGLKEAPFATGAAALVSLAPQGGKVAAGDPSSLFVGHIRVPGPGTYWLLAELDGGSVNGLGNVVVHPHTAAPAVGARAPDSRTPTLATTKDVALLTTRVPPDRDLLRVSVADALKRHEPFVVAFATPKFCSSRTCGPVVDVVDAARKRWAGSPVRFIHVEIYTDNNPAKGPNVWVRQWRLPSEPWVFLVGRDGRIKARFEGALGQSELASAIRGSLRVPPPRP